MRRRGGEERVAEGSSPAITLVISSLLPREDHSRRTLSIVNAV